jgi:hypothetical protein
MNFQISNKHLSYKIRILCLAQSLIFSLNSHAISETNAKPSYKPVAEKNFSCSILFPKSQNTKIVPVKNAVDISTLKNTNDISSLMNPTDILSLKKLSIPKPIQVEKIYSSLSSAGLVVSTTFIDRLFSSQFFEVIAFKDQLGSQIIQLELHPGMDQLIQWTNEIQNSMTELQENLDTTKKRFWTSYTNKSRSIQSQFQDLSTKSESARDRIDELDSLIQQQSHLYEDLNDYSHFLNVQLQELITLNDRLMNDFSHLQQFHGSKFKVPFQDFYMEPLLHLITQLQYQQINLKNKMQSVYMNVRHAQQTKIALSDFINIHWPEFLRQNKSKIEALQPADSSLSSKFQSLKNLWNKNSNSDHTNTDNEFKGIMSEESMKSVSLQIQSLYRVNKSNPDQLVHEYYHFISEHPSISIETAIFMILTLPKRTTLNIPDSDNQLTERINTQFKTKFPKDNRSSSASVLFVALKIMDSIQERAILQLQEYESLMELKQKIFSKLVVFVNSTDYNGSTRPYVKEYFSSYFQNAFSKIKFQEKSDTTMRLQVERKEFNNIPISIRSLYENFKNTPDHLLREYLALLESNTTISYETAAFILQSIPSDSNLKIQGAKSTILKNLNLKYNKSYETGGFVDYSTTLIAYAVLQAIDRTSSTNKEPFAIQQFIELRADLRMQLDRIIDSAQAFRTYRPGEKNDIDAFRQVVKSFLHSELDMASSQFIIEN